MRTVTVRLELYDETHKLLIEYKDKKEIPHMKDAVLQILLEYLPRWKAEQTA